MNNPPPSKPADPRFAGRDWRTIKVSELVNPDDLRFVEADTTVEAATNLLVDSGAPLLLIRETPQSQSVIGTFDYTDLNAYLLLVVGLAHPDEAHIAGYNEIARKAKEGSKMSLKNIEDIGSKSDPLVFIADTGDLSKAVEIFGGGVHRIVVVEEGTQKAVGILSQSRLVRFLWENVRAFPVLEQLYHQNLRDLRIGGQQPIGINGDKPLAEALTLLLNEGISSLAVLDNARNVIGNISTVDVKLLTKSSSIPLLHNTCIHFISVILSTRGMEEGKDSFPVFHVTPLSTLAHTVAKLVATKAHRMWITDPQSPSSSAPPTPSASHASLVPTTSHSSASPANPSNSSTPSTSSIPATPPSATTPFIAPSGPSISASALSGSMLSGHLVGVISLTDVLNLFARASGLQPRDPSETRQARRRSSSSSARKSVDFSFLKGQK
ncbi:putative cbs domain-containing protein [Phaeomoniella chlamydospora]|uniref:Protein SDS23 n=1 Tax=Phaeomoniella chlamydospora TaxID=158046 RepID=A0A0G2DXL4_PHACM|nr:putative cbs domain-containing protein [Phaeomoniella chlamydospora]